jgi:hypothetical protein
MELAVKLSSLAPGTQVKLVYMVHGAWQAETVVSLRQMLIRFLPRIPCVSGTQTLVGEGNELIPCCCDASPRNLIDRRVGCSVGGD